MQQLSSILCLFRFLCNSDSLRQLDVRGCHEVSASLLLKLPLPNIKILELGVFSDANQDGLRKLLHKVVLHSLSSPFNTYHNLQYEFFCGRV